MTSEDLRILFLGHRGFLGSHIYQELIFRGFACEVISGDISQLQDNLLAPTRNSKVNLLISMAWCSNRNPNYLDSSENYFWAKRHIEIAKFCIENDIFLLIPGTCLEYCSSGTSAYVESKKEVKKFLDENMSADRYLWLRYFYIFSLENRRPGLLRDALMARDERRPFSINSLESGHDFIEVRDAVEQTLKIIQSGSHGVWDIGSGIVRSNLELLSRIQDLEVVPSSINSGLGRPSQSYEEGAKLLISNDRQLSHYTDEFFGTFAS